MSGSGDREKENKHVVFRIRGAKQVLIMAEILALPVGILSNVTVRPAVDMVVFTVSDTLFQTAAGTFFWVLVQ